MANYDLIVLGGGPAGYVGAIRGAQLGKRVACIERERAGGTCLNWGCIPTKSLLRAAELYHLMSHRAAEFGLTFERAAYDWGKIIKRSRMVTDKNAAGIEFLFKKNKVDYIRGAAALEGFAQPRLNSESQSGRKAQGRLRGAGRDLRLRMRRPGPRLRPQGHALHHGRRPDPWRRGDRVQSPGSGEAMQHTSMG